MNEATLCRCLWPARIYETITGHESNCPVEKVAFEERAVEFLKIIAGSDDPNLAALANRANERRKEEA